MIRMIFALVFTLAGLLVASLWWQQGDDRASMPPTPAVRADQAGRLAEVGESGSEAASAAVDWISAGIAAGLTAARTDRAPDWPPVDVPDAAASAHSEPIALPVAADVATHEGDDSKTASGLADETRAIEYVAGHGERYPTSGTTTGSEWRDAPEADVTGSVGVSADAVAEVADEPEAEELIPLGHFRGAELDESDAVVRRLLAIYSLLETTP